MKLDKAGCNSACFIGFDQQVPDDKKDHKDG